MSARQCVALGLRLFAIWMCLDAIQAALFMVASGTSDTAPPFWWQKILGILVTLIVALIVWVLSGPVARGLMSRLEDVPDTKFSAHQAVVVGCVLMGLWWLEQSIFVVVVEWLRTLSVSPEYGQSAKDWLRTDHKITLFSGLLQIGVSLFFVCCPHVIANAVLRRANIRK
ncbi:hypothetical protein [Dyella mobilis]|uniref:DUF4149 domain-containing protein n=1 Tax=Dyella mobilis TaxID=1849582 RepID=A0ABS2KMT4_9GAMM|nr:hypothetical protein [Dyella mobilis]MBM7132280.1 hypothetical protein [Dyella mobilis]GLQ95735.1 hypothetical protein GCM10007863_01530 [Dyella mobilis]